MRGKTRMRVYHLSSLIKEMTSLEKDTQEIVHFILSSIRGETRLEEKLKPLFSKDFSQHHKELGYSYLRWAIVKRKTTSQGFTMRRLEARARYEIELQGFPHETMERGEDHYDVLFASDEVTALEHIRIVHEALDLLLVWVVQTLGDDSILSRNIRLMQ